MVFFDYFGKIPKLRRPPHVFSLERVVDGFHMFEGLGRSFQFFVLPLLPGEHSLPDDAVLDILMNCLVDVLEHFNRLLDDLIFELLIAVVFPNPISSEALEFLLEDCFFFFFQSLLHFHFAVFFSLWVEGVLGPTCVPYESRSVINVA